MTFVDVPPRPRDERGALMRDAEVAFVLLVLVAWLVLVATRTPGKDDD